MTLLTESDLTKSEPLFLWRSPLSYVGESNVSSSTLIFGRLSRAARCSVIGLFSVLALAGIIEIIFGWPWYAAMLPIAITSVGVWEGSIRRRKFAGCQIEVTNKNITITNYEYRLELSPVVEIRVENRWKRRDGSFIVDGDSELFIAIDEAPGRKLFFPLANSGVLRDLDALAADIASSVGCPVNMQLVK